MRSQRQLALRKRKKKWPKVLLGILLVLVVLGVIFVVKFPTINNAWRNTTGTDTPADTAVKSTLVKKIEEQKTGNSAVDARIDEAASTLKATKMATIVKAAGDQTAMTSLLKQTTGATSEQAKAAAALLFASPELTDVREAVAAGDWVKAYQAYRDLNGSAALSSLKATLGQY
ncbi:hypothetical protein [Lacticaseibacillus kribbianus]|uniref:hypothetical protein n=1 Tax=Lacticaseibacillus kribbianus TaxID=2926292 RepID=UPI001CD50094|nr:hypothetical protein [Lacticaseibacillus kribbianus]